MRLLQAHPYSGARRRSASGRGRTQPATYSRLVRGGRKRSSLERETRFRSTVGDTRKGVSGGNRASGEAVNAAAEQQDALRNLHLPAALWWSCESVSMAVSWPANVALASCCPMAPASSWIWVAGAERHAPRSSAAQSIPVAPSAVWNGTVRRSRAKTPRRNMLMKQPSRKRTRPSRRRQADAVPATGDVNEQRDSARITDM